MAGRRVNEIENTRSTRTDDFELSWAELVQSTVDGIDDCSVSAQASLAVKGRDVGIRDDRCGEGALLSVGEGNRHDGSFNACLCFFSDSFDLEWDIHFLKSDII